MNLRRNTSGFTLVELIIGMTVFSIGLTGIYALLQTTISNASYSRDEIVAAGLLSEQMNLVSNLRDTNVRNFISWDSLYLEPPGSETVFSSGYYMIENNFSEAGIVIDPSTGYIAKNNIKIIKIDSMPISLEDRWNKTQLRVDDYGRYVHSELQGKNTEYASYLVVSPLVVDGIEVKKNNKNQGWIIDARTIVKRGLTIREYDAKTMITDWQK
ncbi:prepilin-type N-terminal cleavage/methylation domain-containing protein [Candidatus Gracilibacteria bacterium]|nr:prepilin-type N-terminal cleavage/methylation domain-containing protein [Candidatus Gracilibacteria bacterium]